MFRVVGFRDQVSGLAEHIDAVMLVLTSADIAPPLTSKSHSRRSRVAASSAAASRSVSPVIAHQFRHVHDGSACTTLRLSLPVGRQAQKRPVRLKAIVARREAISKYLPEIQSQCLCFLTMSHPIAGSSW